MENLMSFSGLSHALGATLFSPSKLASPSKLVSPSKLAVWEGEQGTGQSQKNWLSLSLIEGFSSVSIDSRTLRAGALFVALRGSAMDGHNFVESAFKAGASGAMVALSALKDPALSLMALAQRCSRVLIAVEDTLKGLQEAAGAYLGQFTKLIKIGITGSTGKTTTKEIAAAIIGQEKSVIMNKGNLNSETGLPLAVFDVRPHHEVGIFEAGMNREGEIAELAKVLNPRLALITNIGSAHIGILGSRQAIAEEKKDIFSAFDGDCVALIPVEDDFRDFLAKDIRGRTVFYGASSLKALGGTKDLGLAGTEITWEGGKARFPLPGKFNLANAIAAISLALELNVSAASVRRGLASVKPLFGRGEILYGRTTLIRDCYNSNPESASQALDFCDGLEWPGRRVYVMGSMLELGEVTEDAHAALGSRLADCKADMVFLFGEEIAAAAEVLEKNVPQSPMRQRRTPSPQSLSQPSFFYTVDRNELSRELDNYVKSGDLVLLKGSRGCELETLTGMLLGDADVS